MMMQLACCHITMLCKTYSERLVFHACPETKPTFPTEFPWFFSVLPDRVRVFLKCYKAGLATHAAPEESICGPLSPEQFL
jgi:hypothetical protein